MWHLTSNVRHYPWGSHTVIPELLGGPDTLMIGRVLWNEFFSNRDWPVASAVAIAMLVILVVPIMLLRGAQARTEES